MARLTMQVSRLPTNERPSERIVNVLHFDTEDPVGAPDHSALATDLAAIFNARLYPIQNFTHYEVKVYDKADAIPRLPKATVKVAQTGTPNPPAVHEVALCLSFYAGSNTPSRRGRLYLGPWSGGLDPRPTQALGERLLDMANDFSALGGANVTWQVYSPRTGQTNPVTNAWVDDAWDIQRRRGLPATTRWTRAVSG